MSRLSETSENIALPDMMGAMRIHLRRDLAWMAVRLSRRLGGASLGRSVVVVLEAQEAVGRRSMMHDSREVRVRVYVEPELVLA